MPAGYDLLDTLFDPASPGRSTVVGDVADYFVSFTGRRFERFHPTPPDRLESADLVAVSMLSVDVGGAAAIDLLETRGEQVNALLAQLPSVALHEAADGDIDPVSPAWQLWDVLRAAPGVGRTTASKLMARKRPHFIPVQDTGVMDMLGKPGDFWNWMRDWLTSGQRVEWVASVRAGVGGIDDISLLRVVDVAVWRAWDRRRRAIPELPKD